MYWFDLLEIRFFLFEVCYCLRSVELVPVVAGKQVNGGVRHIALSCDQVGVENVRLFGEGKEFVDQLVKHYVGRRIDKRRALIHDGRYCAHWSVVVALPFAAACRVLALHDSSAVDEHI